MKEKLKCKKCGYHSDDYVLKETDLHNSAHCRSCGSWLKHISKKGHQSEALLQSNCFIWHWNTYPAERGRLFAIYNNPKNKAHGAYLKGQGLVKGVSDMAYITKNGETIFIEMKTETPKGRQSDAQKEWQKTVEQIGCTYLICRTEQQFQNIIKQYQ